MNPKQRQLYTKMLDNPPQRAARALSDNFWAGFDGIAGVRKGVAGSLARAAWLAGSYASRNEPERSRVKEVDKFNRRNVLIDLAKAIDSLERTAHDAKALITAQALNRAKNACGWEAAENIDEAINALHGRRIGESG